MKADQAGAHPIPEPGRPFRRTGAAACSCMCLILDLFLSLSLSSCSLNLYVVAACLLVARVHWICVVGSTAGLRHLPMSFSTRPHHAPNSFAWFDLLSPQMNPAFGPVTNCRSTWLHRALLLRGKKSSGCECGRQTGRAYGEHWFSTFPTNLANRCLYLSAPLHAHEHGASRTKHGVSSNN